MAESVGCKGLFQLFESLGSEEEMWKGGKTLAKNGRGSLLKVRSIVG